MSEAIVAKRYAEALFQLGSEKSTLDELMEEFLVVRRVFNGNDELYTFLEHPKVKVVDKLDLLDQFFSKLHVDVLNTVKILVERHRIGALVEIIDAFKDLVNDRHGIKEAIVYSVRELSSAEKAELEKSLRKQHNQESIKLENRVDGSLMGGLKIRIGNTIYDGSVSRKLNRIKRDIIKANN